MQNANLFVDLPGYKSPSIISSDTFRPDLLLSISSDYLYILELSVGYESNLQANAIRKRERYKDLITEQKKHYKFVKFVNLSISSLGVFSKECDAFLDMLNDLRYCIGKIMSIVIRSTYTYIIYSVVEIRTGQLQNYQRFRDTFQIITFYQVQVDNYKLP